MYSVIHRTEFYSVDSVIQPSHNRGLEIFPQLVNAYKYGLVIPPLKATFSRGMKDKAGGDEKKVIKKIKNESVTFELIKDIFIIPPTHSFFFCCFQIPQLLPRHRKSPNITTPAPAVSLSSGVPYQGHYTESCVVIESSIRI